MSSSPTTVDWAGGPTGNAGSVGVTVSNLENPYLDTAELSGFDFAAAPLPAAPSEVLVYEGRSDWTATLSAPVTRLLLHASFWRGNDAGIDPVLYYFEIPFHILSGFDDATIVGNSGGQYLQLPGSGFHSGILEFCGPISSVALSTESPSTSDQALTFSVSPLPGATPVSWNSLTEGTAGDVGVAVSGLLDVSFERSDYANADFAAGPLCANALTLDYEVGSDWTTTLSEPGGFLLLYVQSWRGAEAGVDPVTYEFDRPFTILSGLAEASVSAGGTVLTLPASGFHDGILRFAGPIESLAVDTNSTQSGRQSMTLAVPEPAAGAAALASFVALFSLRRGG